MKNIIIILLTTIVLTSLAALLSVENCSFSDVLIFNAIIMMFVVPVVILFNIIKVIRFLKRQGIQYFLLGTLSGSVIIVGCISIILFDTLQKHIVITILGLITLFLLTLTPLFILKKIEKKRQEQENKNADFKNKTHREKEENNAFWRDFSNTDIIAIDLGTSYSSVALFSGGKPLVLPNEYGETKIPSKVLLLKDNRFFVGTKAERTLEKYAGENITVSGIKRKIGTDYSVFYNNATFYPQVLYALILAELKVQAERYLGKTVEYAVIAIPANFSRIQRDIVHEAANLIGLSVVRMLNEAVVSAIIYGEKKKGKNENIIIYDFGGGSLDISLLSIGDGVYEVRGVDGDLGLGGIDFDDCIYNNIVKIVEKDTGFDIRHDEIANLRIKEEAEKAKHILSSTHECAIHIPNLINGGPIKYNLNTNLTRNNFEQMTSHLINKSYEIYNRLLRDCSMASSDLDNTILVGGMSRMPAITQLFEKNNIRLYKGMDRDLSVVCGAAYQAGILCGACKDVLILDICPTSLGIINSKDKFESIIPYNETIPTKKSKIFSTSTDNQTAVDIKIVEKYKHSDVHLQLGLLQLYGIQPAPKGTPVIEVCFDMDINGGIHVSAKDLVTKKHVETTLSNTKYFDEKGTRDISFLIQEWIAMRKIELNML